MQHYQSSLPNVPSIIQFWALSAHINSLDMKYINLYRSPSISLFSSTGIGHHCETWSYHCSIQCAPSFRCCSCSSFSFSSLRCWVCSYLVANSIFQMELHPLISIHSQLHFSLSSKYVYLPELILLSHSHLFHIPFNYLL